MSELTDIQAVLNHINKRKYLIDALGYDPHYDPKGEWKQLTTLKDQIKQLEKENEMLKTEITKLQNDIKMTDINEMTDMDEMQICDV